MKISWKRFREIEKVPLGQPQASNARHRNTEDKEKMQQAIAINLNTNKNYFYCKDANSPLEKIVGWAKRTRLALGRYPFKVFFCDLAVGCC